MLLTGCKNEPKPTCLPYYWHRDLCSVDYRSYTEIMADGKAALGKRAQLVCEHMGFTTNKRGDPMLTCWLPESSRKIFFYDSATSDGVWSPDKKKFLLSLPKRATIEVDFAIHELFEDTFVGEVFTVKLK
jgi:hypothetical protein